MGQDRLNNLARLSVESDIEKHTDFDTVIRSFAKKKACKKKTDLIKSVYVLILLLFVCLL